MLKHIPPGLRSGLVAAVAALLPLTEAAATGFGGGATLPTGAGAAALRSCSIPVGTGSVKVYAGDHDIYGNPVGPFPVTVVNTAPVGSTALVDGNCLVNLTHNPTGTCLRWDYQWNYTGVLAPATYNVPSYVTLDSDLNLFATLPAARVSQPPIGDPLDIAERVREVRVVRFSANATPFNASFYTATNAQVGKVTAGFKSLVWPFKEGTCAIQGAEKPTGDTALTQAQSITTTVGACTVTWALSADGCVSGASASPATCTVTTKAVVVGTGTASTATCGTELGGAFGSTEVCRWNSLLRKATCVTVP